MQALAMAASFVSQITHFLSFLRDHPKITCLLLLFLSPPIFRVLLYFTPLLLSTALCIFALFTLSPYVTATDAEVERQSLLGASSYQRKKMSSTPSTTSKAGEKGTAGGRHGNFSSSSASLSSSSSASVSSSSVTATSASAISSYVSPSPSPAAENSWMSWMKGLNDIGRAWMESRLAEQGLALSEPANRETLLALIEGSFAELVTIKDNNADLFSIGGNDVETDHNVMQLKDVDETLPKLTNSDEVVMEGLLEHERDADIAVPEIHDEAPKNACAEESALPISSVAESQADESSARAEEHHVTADDGILDNSTCNKDALDSKEVFPAVSEASFKHSNLETPCHSTQIETGKPLSITHEIALPVIDARADAHTATTIMPKTPSRIPAPSRLLEASRRMFSREEQSKSMLPRAPLQSSSTGRLQSHRVFASGTNQNKMESTVSAFKLPTRKFLDRSKSISSKEGCKLGSDDLMEHKATGNLDKGCRVADQDKVKQGGNVCVSDSNEGVSALAVSFGELADDTNGNGPKFDEDLEVEEAQALVRSELKMLEVELEEVAAKLPKLDEASVYQKTPTPVKSVNSTVAMPSPVRTPFRSNIALFSASPISK